MEFFRMVMEESGPPPIENVAIGMASQMVGGSWDDQGAAVRLVGVGASCVVCCEDERR